ncbi:DNA packaging tegument protein UL25 [Saimiriine alphaherpesvirus 1]|uniref:DNA packaging tegument protein UL25 n=2 Tax=Saimiriine herpesvirus 1 (strain MV-5-4-PSL) TaxID=10353 RepID=E2IUE5_SHV1|nr:DNA packaging tegument protein UL25 [Saimiriine alphaherpesvirus 1]ADO13803.1 DNA packaging tegument protein UL25 [Saimiriine alphaherpesvirus 1]
MDPHFPFETVGVWDHKRIILADARSFITPNVPVRMWAEPVFTARESAERQLAVERAKRLAAAAALENAALQARDLPMDIDRRLRPIERQVEGLAEAIDVLETAAAAAEEADAAAASESRATEDRESEIRDADGDLPRDVQIARNDPPLRYDSNLPIDMLYMVYASRNAGAAGGVGFGSWYRTLQDRTASDYPATGRTADFRDGRMSRTFMAAAVSSLQSCGRLYVGQRHYSALECAALCLHLLHRTTERRDERSPGTFAELLANVPSYTEAMAAAIAGDGGRATYRFREEKMPKAQVAAPGGRYERGALTKHSVVSALLNRGVLAAPPGDVPGGAASAVDPERLAHQDDVNRAAAAFLSRGHNLFLWEDQTLLRAAVNTITGLLVLQRLLYNGNVYADRLANRFQIGMLIPGAVPSGAIAKGASGGLDAAAVKSGHNNFEALVRGYVLPLYEADPTVELTQLFPGLAALSLDTQAGRPAHHSRRVVDVSSGGRQAALVRLTALELSNRPRPQAARVGEVISAHDALALQFEQGLGILAQQPRIGLSGDPKRLGAFNVDSDYDLLYFLCLGFIPQFLTVA